MLPPLRLSLLSSGLGALVLLAGCGEDAAPGSGAAGTSSGGGATAGTPPAASGSSSTLGGQASSGGSSNQAGAIGTAGNVTVGGAAGGSTSSGGSSAMAGSATGGSTSSGGSSSSGGSGGASNCAGALICDDFEAYTGTPGAPWKVTKNTFGNVVIDGAQHRSGGKAVKFTTSGGKDPDFYQLAFMSLETIFPVDNNAFYGRMMIYATKAANDGVHWTMIEGEGAASAQGLTNAQVRYGGQHQQRLMASYDSAGKKSDCWKHSATKMPEAKWACMEWYFDGATNTQKFWLDGAAIDDITVTDQGEGCLDQGTGGKWIYPSFSRLNLGWASYQKDDPREVWIDDVAIGTAKLGCPP